MKIKQIITLTVLAIAFSNSIFSQVGIGTTTPQASAELDVTSTNKGFLPPRMTQAQRDAIASPATGLIVWCTNCGTAGELQVYNGTVWSASGSAASGLIIKRVAMNTLTAGANGLYTITDTDLPSNASLPILVSYEDVAGTVTTVNLSNRAAGVFSVTLAATAANTGFLNYAYPSENVTVVAGTTGATGPAGPAGANGSNGAAGAAATVAVGTVTALAAGATPTVTNSGTTAAATLNFGIPTSIPVYKGTQATNGTNASFTIANSNITATSVVTVSYFNSSNEIISHAISAITAGSFTVQFAAAPANGGSILYTIVN